MLNFNHLANFYFSNNISNYNHFNDNGLELINFEDKSPKSELHALINAEYKQTNNPKNNISNNQKNSSK